MNALLLVAAAILMKNERFKGMIDILKSIDFQSFKPILKLIGMNDGAVEFICSEKFSALLEGGLDLKSLGELFAVTTPHATEKEAEEKREYLGLEPIKEVASSEIEESLGSFFS